MNALNILARQDVNDTWTDGSILNASSANAGRPSQRASVKMLRVSTELDDSIRADTEEVPSLDNDSASPMRYSPAHITAEQMQGIDEVIELTEPQLVPACRLSNNTRIEIDRVISTYNLGIQDSSYPGELKDCIVWVHKT